MPSNWDQLTSPSADTGRELSPIATSGDAADLTWSAAGTEALVAVLLENGYSLTGGGLPGGSAGAADLAITPQPGGIILESSTGTDVTLPLSDGTNAGLMAPAQHTKLAGISTGATANANTDALSEGATNLYHTSSRVNALITAAVGVSVQAYNAGLAAIAALTTTAFGRSLLELASAAALRTAIALPTTTVAGRLARYTDTSGTQGETSAIYEPGDGNLDIGHTDAALGKVHAFGGPSGVLGGSSQRVAVLHGLRPELLFKDTDGAGSGLAMVKWGGDLYFSHANASQGYLSHAAAIDLSNGQWRIGHGNTALGQIDIRSRTAAIVGAVIRGAASQTADLLKAQNSSGADLFAVTANGSHVSGPAVNRGVVSNVCAGTSFAANGDAQRGEYVLRCQTTDATTTGMTINGAAAGSTNQIILPNDASYAFEALVVGRRTDVDGESAAYQIRGCIDRNADAASTALVGSVTVTVISEDNAGWNATAVADTTNGGLRFNVAGEAAKTVRWVAVVRTAEVVG